MNIINDTLRFFRSRLTYYVRHSRADFWVVDECRSQVVGRPTVFLAVDSFSGLIAGTFVTVSDDFGAAAAQTVSNAACEKVQYCRNLGIKISAPDWPAVGQPEAIVDDRPYLRAPLFRSFALSLSVPLVSRSYYSWEPQSYFSRYFRILGSAHLSLAKNGDPRLPDVGGDVDLPRLLTVRDVTALAICISIEANKTRRRMPHMAIAKEAKPIPNALWEWAVNQRAKFPLEAQLRECEPDRLPSAEARVTVSGIELHGLNYVPEDTSFAAGLRGYARIHPEWKKEVRFDPTCVRAIYVAKAKKPGFERCVLDKSLSPLANLSWAEFLDRFQEPPDSECSGFPQLQCDHC